MSVLALFVLGLVSAFLPGIGSEVIVLAAAAAAHGPWVAALILLAAAAQAMGKLGVYGLAAAGARAAPASGFGLPVLRAALERSACRAAAMIFMSALASVPPLYMTAIVCGAAHYGGVRFLCTVFAARAIRYAVVIGMLHPLRMVVP